MHWLWYAIGLYLMICYVWAMLLALRLWWGRRLRLPVRFRALFPPRLMMSRLHAVESA